MISPLISLLVSKRVAAFTPKLSRHASTSVPASSELKATSLFQDIDEYFEDAMRPVTDFFDRSSLLPDSRWKGMELRRLSPRFDISEGEAEFKVAIEVPDLTLDDIKVEFNEGSNMIRLAGGRKVDEKGEFYESSFEKHFRIGKHINVDKIEATLENGILAVTLPKDEKFMNVRTIPIKAGAGEKVPILKGVKEK